MKHVGKMKNNSARVAVAYRTIPGDAASALVIGTSGLPDAYHDSLMALIESDAGQQANELADVLATRRFPDGGVMLQWLHAGGHLKKVPTTLVLMTPNNQTIIPLNELNVVIAEQKGVAVDELAVTEDGKPATKKELAAAKKNKEEIIVTSEVEANVSSKEMTPTEMRSRADKLFKEAQALRKQADAVDPPKSKKKEAAVVDVE
jgi:hypothetical protein